MPIIYPLVAIDIFWENTHIYIYLMDISGLIIEGYCYSFIDH